MGRRLICVAVLLASQLLAGCGQKGPLYRDAGQETAPVTEVSPASVRGDDEDRSPGVR